MEILESGLLKSLMKQQYRHTKPYRGKDPDFTSEFDKEIARETAKYIAETTPEERVEDDYHLQRGCDEAKGELERV